MTDTRTPSPGSPNSRDTAAETLRLLGIGNVTPEKLERRRREYLLQQHADRCAECDAPFTEDDVVYRRGGFRRWRDSFTERVLPYCAACSDVAAHPERWLAVRPCEMCGRPVSNSRATADPHRFTRDWSSYGERDLVVHVVCSEACRRRLYRTPAERAVRPCEECGEPFTARADARFCSARCRQRAHRSICKDQPISGLAAERSSDDAALAV